jgi:hypothetical protein
MKMIYALTVACLSLQACNDPSSTPTASINISEHSTLGEYLASMGQADRHTAAITAPAGKPFEGYWMDDPIAYSSIDFELDEYNVGAITPAIRPIDGAEFEGTSRDDAYTAWSTEPIAWDYAIDSGLYINDDDHTGVVTVPVAPKGDARRIDWDGDFYVNEEGFTLADPAGRLSVRASD